MQEAVVFPRPEEVNIIATRNGELTNIPGTEFRAPLLPYKSKLRFSAGKVAYIDTSSDVTPIPLGVFLKDSIDGKWECFAACYNVHQSLIEDSSDTGWQRTYFRAMLNQYKKAPEYGEVDIGILIQLIGNKTTQFIDDTGGGSGDYQVILPPSHSERFFLIQKNHFYDDFWTPYA